MVVADVDLVPRDHELDAGAEAARLGHLGAGLHAEGLGFHARHDANRGVGEHRHHAQGLAAQPRFDLLLHGGEIGIEVDEQRTKGHGRGMTTGRLVASMNLRRKTSGSAMSRIGATEVPAPEMKMVPKLSMRPHTPCSTLRASTLSKLISTVWRFTKPLFAMTRRLVMASSVERMRIHAMARKTRPTTITSVTRPSTMSGNCDHQEMRARWMSVSPPTRDSSI